MSDRLSKLENRVSTVEADLKSIKKDVKDIKKSIAKINDHLFTDKDSKISLYEKIVIGLVGGGITLVITGTGTFLGFVVQHYLSK